MSHVSSVVADSPVSFWLLNESSESVAADQVGINQGTYNGGVGYAQQGFGPGEYQFNQFSIARFDGHASFVAIPITDEVVGIRLAP